MGSRNSAARGAMGLKIAHYAAARRFLLG